MDKDTKILLMAVVIILVALVSFNLSDMTGQAVKSGDTTITVSPTIITFGLHDTAKMITIRVSPGKGGIDKKIQMYREKGTSISTETATLCRKFTCYDDVTISYRAKSGLPAGRYYFKAAKSRTGEIFKSNLFEIRHE